jgi:hypothetical protein
MGHMASEDEASPAQLQDHYNCYSFGILYGPAGSQVVSTDLLIYLLLSQKEADETRTCCSCHTGQHERNGIKLFEFATDL